MARRPSPWYRAERNDWCVTLNGKRHSLGEHPPGAPTPKQSYRTGRWNIPDSINKAFQILAVGRTASPMPVQAGEQLVDLFQAFLTWTKSERAPITAKRYLDFLESFNLKYPGMTAIELHSGHVTDWLNEKKWNGTTRRNAIIAVSRALNWCCKNKGLARNPIHGMDKPKTHRQKGVVSTEDMEIIIKRASREFADLITVSYDSGARPFEIKDLEHRHMDVSNQRAIIPADEAKGRRHTRVIYFPSKRSMDIIRRLCDAYPEGPLFRNTRGSKWTGNAVKCAFARLETEIGKRIKHYDFRRTYITRKIIAGVDSHVVAKLAGHTSTAMIDRHYSAVADDHDFMLKMAGVDVTKPRLMKSKRKDDELG